LNGHEPAAAAGLRRRMVRGLARGGVLPPAWGAVLEVVPRHVFVPDTVWHPTVSGYLPLCRGDDPFAWLGLAHRDDRLVVQVDDGAPVGVGRQATCSVLAPSEVALVLSTVDAQPGMRVCVVGAGLGYLTAVLAHRLGADAVCAVEIDPGLARDGHRRLSAAGFGGVRVRTGDGTAELPAGLPFDRLVCTATVQRVPEVWLRRVRPGGVIVTGFGSAHYQEALARLDVRSSDHAAGKVVGELGCEWVRGQRLGPVWFVDPTRTSCATRTTSGSDIIRSSPEHPITSGVPHTSACPKGALLEGAGMWLSFRGNGQESPYPGS
jgi:protein-L-isoaspartate O-methyltransferase